MLEFIWFVIRFFVDAFGGWRRSSGLFCLSMSLVPVLEVWFLPITFFDARMGLFATIDRIIFLIVACFLLIAACFLLSGKQKPRKHFWQTIPDLPPVPRDPHGATLLNQMLIAKFQKSRSGC